jgi:hypothetical protein
MEQWEKNFYITALAGANNGSSLVVMSRGNTIGAGLHKILPVEIVYYKVLLFCVHPIYIIKLCNMLFPPCYVSEIYQTSLTLHRSAYVLCQAAIASL